MAASRDLRRLRHRLGVPAWLGTCLQGMGTMPRRQAADGTGHKKQRWGLWACCDWHVPTMEGRGAWGQAGDGTGPKGQSWGLWASCGLLWLTHFWDTMTAGRQQLAQVPGVMPGF